MSLDLKEKLSDAVAKASTIADRVKKESRSLSADEKKEILSLNAEADKLDAEIKEIEESNEIVSMAEARQKRMYRPEARKVPASEPESRSETRNDNPYTFVRHGSLKNFSGSNAEERAHLAGRWFLALAGSENSRQWLRDHGISMRAGTGSAESVGSTGGYLVPDQFLNDVIDNREQFGVARKYARVVPMSRDHLLVPIRKSGISTAWYGEAAAITEQDMAWSQATLTAKKLGGLVYMSSEIAEDAAISIGDWLVGELGYSFAIAEDDALFNGDGGASFGNITGLTTLFVNGLNSLTGAVNATSGHATAAAITTTDLAAMLATLPAYADADDAAIYCSKQFKANAIDRLKAAGGGNQVQTLGEKPQDQWMGYPIRISQKLGTGASSSTGKVACLFGSMKRAALLGDRRQMSVARSADYLFANDQIAIRATERLDINIVDVGTTSVAGPVVALMYA